MYAAGLMLAAILTHRNSFFLYQPDVRGRRMANFSQMKVVYGIHNIKNLARSLYKRLDNSILHSNTMEQDFKRMEQYQEQMDGKMSTFIKKWKNTHPEYDTWEVRLISEDKSNYLLDFLDNLTELRFWRRPIATQIMYHPFISENNIQSSCKKFINI